MTSRNVLNLVLVGAWLALLYISLKAALTLAAAATFAHGIVGAARRKITTKGRSGPAKTYIGRAAVHEGLFIAFCGLVMGLFLVAGFWLLPMWQR